MSKLDIPHFANQPLFFGQKTFRANLQNKAPITVFKDAIAGANHHFETRFLEGEDIRQLVHERATFFDLILHYAWHQFSWDNDITLAAVGGYGRGELILHSDIDILVLLENSADNKYSTDLQAFITFLWDIGLEVGSSVRTLDQCVELSKGDVTIATNLLECRHLNGNALLLDQLRVLTGPEHMWSAEEFYQAKIQEQKERHEKYLDSEYNLEPNIKNAPGGLRDLQTINWLAKRYYGVKTLLQLQGTDFFREYEFGVFQQSEATLWRVRYAVHYIAKRADERLLFERQKEIAKLFGYQTDDNGLAVEKFMREYYRTVLAVRELNDILLEYLHNLIHNKNREPKITAIDDDFQLKDNHIAVRNDQVFRKNPSALLKIFVILGQTPSIEGVTANTIRLIRENRGLINAEFRADPKNHALFLDLFRVEYGLVTQLKRMKRYYILGRYLPEFGAITGQMQFDLFHRYTVDEHTLLVIQNMRHFTLKDAEVKFPVAAHIVKRIPKPELLYLSGLYHDIGKGRGGDHSELGAIDAKEFCLRHGMSSVDANLVSWLVEKHLLMSFISQKKDLSDPETIQQFAEIVGDQMRLDYLYLLTVADMCGTNPEIWNSWRASLMRQLYLETKRALRRGLENPVDKLDRIEETKHLAIARIGDKEISQTKAKEVLAQMADDYFIRESHLDIAWHLEEIIAHKNIEEPLVSVRDAGSQYWGGATQIFLHTKDASNVFHAATTALAQLDLNIVDARLYSSANGYTTDTFFVLNEDFEPLGEDEALFEKIKLTLIDELSLVGEYSEVVKRRTPRQLKQFTIPTRTSITQDSSGQFTILEVISPDRHGLLATMGRVFSELELQVQNAKISTLGERVEDIFYLTDKHGNAITDLALCEELQRTLCRELDSQVQNC